MGIKHGGGMKVLHISEITNRDSIFKNGIKPTKVKNDFHLEYFKKENICTKDGKIIYAWIENEKKNKFIKDLIYAKVWIHPRNELLDIYERKFNDYIDFRRFHMNPICNYDKMIFDVYEIESVDLYSYNDHIQIRSKDIYGTCHKMHVEYEHEDKELIFYNKPIHRNFFKIIGQAYYEFDYRLNKMIIKSNV